MTSDRLHELLDHAILGDIAPADHAELQDALKRDLESRRLYRERMDIEASLKDWAEEALDTKPADPASRSPLPATISGKVIAAVLSCVVCMAVLISFYTGNNNPPLPSDIPEVVNSGDSTPSVGRIRFSKDAQRAESDVAFPDRFRTELVNLKTGIAELLFDSGTNLILEAPCELAVLSADAARLIRGNVTVNVTERSNGFVLETPEATIYDEGTEYAVALDDTATEVHVFDGSVICVSEQGDTATEDLIEAGEAFRFDRRTSRPPGRVPFGQRQFVRELDARIERSADGELLAFDGFENIAGRLRRGRSGFGWEGGWTAMGRKRGPHGEVVPAPSGSVFGFDRNDRMCLRLADSDLRRTLSSPITIENSQPVFVSFVLNRELATPDENSESSFRLSIEPAAVSYRRRFPITTFGISSDGFPYINNAGQIEQTAIHLPYNLTLLVVLKLHRDENVTRAAARIYQEGQRLDAIEPLAWTIRCDSTAERSEFDSLRLSASGAGAWLVDELRLSTTWSSAMPHEAD